LPSLGFLGPVGGIGDHDILDHICLHAMHLLLCLNIYSFTHVAAVHAPLMGLSHLDVHVGTAAVAPPKNGYDVWLGRQNPTSELHVLNAHCDAL